jgi:hypothetical protein
VEQLVGQRRGFPSPDRQAAGRRELAALIGQAGKVRVVGAGHSFMPLCETSDLLLNLSDYEGAVEIAPDRKTVWAPAGLEPQAADGGPVGQGLSLINQGDINPQSLAGAISTGTHGTGAELGSLSTQACGFRLMTADGAIVECGPDQNPELYQAQRLSLGLLGVAVEIRIHVVPAYHLEERVERRPAGRGRRAPGRAGRRHAPHGVLRLSLFGRRDLQDPASGRAQASGRPAREIGEDSEATFKTICDLCAAVPILTPSLQRLMMRMMGKSSRRVGPAHEIFPSERNIRFEEMEYELPRAAGLPTLKAAMAISASAACRSPSRSSSAWRPATTSG